MFEPTSAGSLDQPAGRSPAHCYCLGPDDIFDQPRRRWTWPGLMILPPSPDFERLN